jgi:hypothetical protein
MGPAACVITVLHYYFPTIDTDVHMHVRASMHERASMHVHLHAWAFARACVCV